MEKTGPDKEDCTCPICLCIMIEPVTMPCKHSLCMPCYKQTVEKSNLCCPICRLRISVWARKASKSKSLIDKTKWEAIKEAFPEKVQNRLEGNDSFDVDSDSDFEDYETQLRKLKELSKPGEIRQEYEAALEKLQHQREEEAKKEEEASAALIRALQQQEEREMEELNRQNEELERISREAAEQLQQDSSFNTSMQSTQDQESSRPVSTNKTKGKSGAKVNAKGKSKSSSRPTSTNLTMDTFFCASPRSVSSAPPIAAQMPGDSVEENKTKNSSPYPYLCISPVDKIFYGLSSLTASVRRRSCSCSSDEAPGLTDHSYTTASARRIDLTTAQSDQWAKQRSDVQSYDLSKVKSEPEDIFGPGPSGICSQKTANLKKGQSGNLQGENHGHFQPILSCQTTPPKRFPNGSVYEAPLVRALPRKLNVDRPGFGTSKTSDGKKSASSNRGAGKSTPNKGSTALSREETSSEPENDSTEGSLSDKNSVNSSHGSKVTSGSSGLSSSVSNVLEKKPSSLSSEENLQRKHMNSETVTLHSKYSVKSRSNKNEESDSDSCSDKDNVAVDVEDRDENNDDDDSCDVSNMYDCQSVESNEKTVVEEEDSSDESDLDKDKTGFGDASSIQILSDSGSNYDPSLSGEAVGGSSDSDTENDVDVTKYSICDTEDSENPESDLNVTRYALCDEEDSNSPTVSERPLTDSRKQNVESGHEETRMSKTARKRYRKNGQSTLIGRLCSPADNVSKNGTLQKKQTKQLDGSARQKSGKRVQKNTLDSFVKRGDSLSSDKDSKVVKTNRTSKNKGRASTKVLLSDCVKGQDTNNDRKRKVSDSNDSDNDAQCFDDIGQSEMTQEEKDRLLARELQAMYDKLDKERISVERFKGAKDEYSLRKKRKVR